MYDSTKIKQGVHMNSFSQKTISELLSIQISIIYRDLKGYDDRENWCKSLIDNKQFIPSVDLNYWLKILDTSSMIFSESPQNSYIK